MRRYLLVFILSSFIGTAYTQSTMHKVLVPVGGNSWVTVVAGEEKEEVTNNGWQHWQHADVVWSTYVKLQKAGTLKMTALLDVPEGESTVQWTIAGQRKTVTVSGAGFNEHEIGEWDILKPGYIKIDAQGISRTGPLFAKVSELLLEGSAVNEHTAFVKNNDDNYFYWGRRGPSVHINYDIAGAEDDIECFYNEVSVPLNNDVIGSYFMAAGFSEGYFGMQVNSPTERRVLFSVWSPFITDNPKEIPDDKKIILVKKGKDVYTGEFGNEGSGGQSYLKYQWKAGETYKFLIKAKPLGNNSTTYTAYFFDNEMRNWLLIASFIRPATHTYLKGLHSFLENFEPITGHISRGAYYQNQWVKTKAGEWKPISQMFLSADATAGKKFRMDYDGGIENERFFMRNCGFFNENAVLQQKFSVKVPVIPPFSILTEPGEF